MIFMKNLVTQRQRVRDTIVYHTLILYRTVTRMVATYVATVRIYAYDTTVRVLWYGYL